MVLGEISASFLVGEVFVFILDCYPCFIYHLNPKMCHTMSYIYYKSIKREQELTKGDIIQSFELRRECINTRRKR